MISGKIPQSRDAFFRVYGLERETQQLIEEVEGLDEETPALPE